MNTVANIPFPGDAGHIWYANDILIKDLSYGSMRRSLEMLGNIYGEVSYFIPLTKMNVIRRDSLVLQGSAT